MARARTLACSIVMPARDKNRTASHVGHSHLAVENGVLYLPLRDMNQDRPRKPSYLRSNSQSGSSNGSFRRVGTIGCTRGSVVAGSGARGPARHRGRAASVGLRRRRLGRYPCRRYGRSGLKRKPMLRDEQQRSDQGRERKDYAGSPDAPASCREIPMMMRLGHSIVSSGMLSSAIVACACSDDGQRRCVELNRRSRLARRFKRFQPDPPMPDPLFQIPATVSEGEPIFFAHPRRSSGFPRTRRPQLEVDAGLTSGTRARSVPGTCPREPAGGRVLSGDRKRVRDDPHAFEPRKSACCAREACRAKRGN